MLMNAVGSPAGHLCGGGSQKAKEIIAQATASLIFLVGMAILWDPAAARACCYDECNPECVNFDPSACGCMYCDDGNPCTIDTCVDDVCVRVPKECGECQQCDPSTGQCQDPWVNPWLSVDRTEVCVGCTVGVTVSAPYIDGQDCGYDLVLSGTGKLAASDSCEPNPLPTESTVDSPAQCCSATAVGFPYWCPPHNLRDWWDCFGNLQNPYCTSVRCDNPTTFTQNEYSVHFKLDEGDTRQFNVVAETCGTCQSLAGLDVNGPSWLHYSTPCIVKVKDKLLDIKFDPEGKLSTCNSVTASIGSHCGLGTAWQWSVTPSDGLFVSPNGSTCYISIEEPNLVKTESVLVTVTNTAATPPGFCAPTTKSRVLAVECGSCGKKPGGCPGGVCGLAGDGVATNTSVNVAISLGENSLGDTAGYVYLLQETPTGLAANQLTLHLPSDTVPVETTRGGKEINQIKVPGALAEIVADDLDSGAFTIDFYTNQVAGDPDGNGVYAPSGSAYRRWTFEDPTGSVDVRVNDNYKVTYGDQDVALISEYTYQGPTEPAGWRMDQRDKAGTLLRTIEHLVQAGTKTYKVLNAQGETVEKAARTYTNGHMTQLTTYADANTAIVANYVRTPEGRRWETAEPSTGTWQLNQYDSSGRIVRTVSNYLNAQKPQRPNSPTDALDDSAGHAFVYQYSGSDHRPTSVTEMINGVVVGYTYYDYGSNSSYDSVVVTRYDSSPFASLTTETWSYPASAPAYRAGRPYRVFHADGTMEEYGYEKGGYSPGGNHTPGTFGGSGDFIAAWVRRGWGSTSSGLHQENKRSTSTVSVTDPAGRVVLEETWIYTTSGDQRIDWSIREYDQQGRLTGVYRQNGQNETTDYDPGTCCGNWMTTGPDGAQTAFKFDSFRRVYQQIKKGYDDTPDIITEHQFDAAGRVTKTITRDDGNTMSTSAETKYDWLGRPIRTTDAGSIHTGYLYEDLLCNNVPCGQKTTVSRYGDVDQQTGAFVPVTGVTVTEITEYYPDGQTKNITGTGVVARTYDYGVDYHPWYQSDYRWTMIYTGPDTSGPWVKTWTDGLGRTVLEEKPAFPGQGVTAIATRSNYDELKGQLVSVEHTYDGSQEYLADSLYVYNLLSEQTASGQDLDTYPGLQASGTNPVSGHSDRIQETDTYYEQDGNQDWWQVSTSKTYAKDGDATATPMGTEKRRLTGFDSGVIEESISIDIYGNQTTMTTTVTPANRRTTRIADVPDSGLNEVNVTENGLLISTTSKTGVETIFDYDNLGRRTHVTQDRHSAATVTAYDSNTDRVTTVTDPANNVTSYAYEAYTGRLASVTRTIGVPPNQTDTVQRFSYDALGRQTHVWGNGAYPAQYGYDDYGRRTTMKTYRGGTGWDSETLPAAFDGDAEVTTWTYDPTTSLLLKKADDSGKYVKYRYTADGKLKSRTWSRHVGTEPTDDDDLKTVYHYYGEQTGEAQTGEMKMVEYPDDGTNTPDVTCSYTRLGQRYQITDGVGTRTFDYDDDDVDDPNDPNDVITNRLHVVSETIEGEGDFNGLNKTITRDYDSLGRDGGFHIATEYGVGYHYNTTDGRFERVTGPGLPGYGVQYSRLASSDLLETASYKSDANTTLASTTKAYEANRDLTTWVDNKVGATTVSKYDYNASNDDLDALGRRTSVVYTGTAFSQNHLFKWGYNARSELTTADRHQGTNPDSPGTQYTQYGDYEFNYDSIGNRQTYGLDANPDTAYTANDLNQYTGTSNPTEYLCYDEDGNLKRDGKATTTCPGTDGLHEYKWDAENRLIEVIPLSPANGARKVKFVHDYMGRRVRKAVYVYNNGWPADDSPTEVQHFVYDGWNVVLVLNGGNETVRKYTWGLDLSRTLHGAGGIGGLLACVETQGTTGEEDDQRYWFFYDANGNVGQVLDATNTGNITLAAHYEYDPYGNVITSSGPYRDANPFRFSTKWFDSETGMYYYGYRYYLPRLGRWGSRDPIGERGGNNLYSFVYNAPILAVDGDGRKVIGIGGLEVLGTGGRKHIDNIGTRILERINAWRKRKGLPPDQYSFIDGTMGHHVADLGAKAREYRDTRKTRCDAQGFVLFGYSDGATTIYRWLQDGQARQDLYVRDVEYRGARYPGYAAISYVAYIDMVRDQFYAITPSELLRKEPPYSNRDLPLSFEPILYSDAYYQDYTAAASLFELMGVGWKGYKSIGSSGTVQIQPSNHLRIIKEPAMQNQVVNDAVEAYIKHVSDILQRRSR